MIKVDHLERVLINKTASKISVGQGQIIVLMTLR